MAAMLDGKNSKRLLALKYFSVPEREKLRERNCIFLASKMAAMRTPLYVEGVQLVD